LQRYKLRISSSQRFLLMFISFYIGIWYQYIDVLWRTCDLLPTICQGGGVIRCDSIPWGIWLCICQLRTTQLQLVINKLLNHHTDHYPCIFCHASMQVYFTYTHSMTHMALWALYTNKSFKKISRLTMHKMVIFYQLQREKQSHLKI